MVVAVDVDIFRSEREVEGVLDHVFIELVVEERVRVLLPCDCFEGEYVVIGEIFHACGH